MHKRLEDQFIIIQASQDKLTSDITDMKSDMNKLYYDMKDINTLFT